VTGDLTYLALVWDTDGTQAEFTQHCVQVVVIDVAGDEIVFSVDHRHSHERVLLARSEDAHIGPAKDPFDGAVMAVENAPHKLNMEVRRRTNEKRGKVVNLCGAYTLCVEWYVEIGRVRGEQGGDTVRVVCVPGVYPSLDDLGCRRLLRSSP